MKQIKKIFHKYKNNSLFNGALFSVFSFINRGFSFLLMMILAGFITPAEYGYLSLYGTVVLLVSFFIAFSSDSYLSITYFAEGKVGISKYFSSIGFTVIFTSFLLITILLLCGEKISEMVELPLPTLYLSVIICAFTVFSNANLDLFRVKEKVKLYGLFSCSNAFLNFAFTIGLIGFLSFGWEGRVYAQTICSIIFGCIGIIIFFRLGYGGCIDKKYLKNMIFWGIPLIPHVATTFLKQGCDRFIINSSYGIEDVGMFSFAMNMANILIMLGNGFNQSNSVDIFKILGNSEMSSIKKRSHLKCQKNLIIKVYLFSGILVLTGIYFVTPILLPKYSSSINYMPLLMISSFFGCVTLLYTSFLYYFKKTKLLMYTTLSCAIGHLFLSFFLTRYSLHVTCLIYCLSQGAKLLMIRHIANKELKLKSQNL